MVNLNPVYVEWYLVVAGESQSNAVLIYFADFYRHEDVSAVMYDDFFI